MRAAGCSGYGHHRWHAGCRKAPEVLVVVGGSHHLCPYVGGQHRHRYKDGTYRVRHWWWPYLCK